MIKPNIDIYTVEKIFNNLKNIYLLLTHLFITSCVQIAPIFLEERKKLSTSLNILTIAEIQKNYPSINWLQYIQATLGSEVSINEFEKVLILFPDFMENVEKLIAKTPQRLYFLLFKIINVI